jgi:hypothetical protein
MRTDDASLPELTSRPNEIGRLLDQTGLDAISRYLHFSWGREKYFTSVPFRKFFFDGDGLIGRSTIWKKILSEAHHPSPHYSVLRSVIKISGLIKSDPLNLYSYLDLIRSEVKLVLIRVRNNPWVYNGCGQKISKKTCLKSVPSYPVPDPSYPT